jgi:RAD50-interacting protein 1
LTDDNIKASPLLSKTLKTSTEVIHEVDEKFEYVDIYLTKIQNKIEKYREVHEEIQSHLEKISELEHLIEYFRILQDIQDISSELENCIYSKDEQKIVNLFLSLSGSPESSDSVLGRLQDVDAPHMKLYSRRVALYWHEVIVKKLSR